MCIVDSSINVIWFDESGECKYCKIHDQLELDHLLGPELDVELDTMIRKIKKQVLTF